MAIEITDSNFPEYLKGEKLIVVDFWAPWCGPCKAIGPIIEELSNEYKNKAIIGKCDVDENAEIPAKYGIRNVPTLLFFKNGEVVDKHIGNTTKTVLSEKIKSHL